MPSVSPEAMQNVLMPSEADLVAVQEPADVDRDANAARISSTLIPAPPQASSRYNRQLLVPQISLSGHARLSRARVLVIGLGGLGSPASMYLAGAGVRTLGLLDHDMVETSNLHRQIVHRESSVKQTMSKVDSAKRALEELNSEVQYVSHPNQLTAGNALDIFAKYDVVLDCTDNPATRYLISDVCVLLGKPLISGAAQRTEGQMMVLNYPVNVGPCYRCMFPVPPPPEMARSCSEIGVLGTAVGTIGVLMAGEAIRVIVDRERDEKEGWKGTMLLYNAWPKDPKAMFRSIGLRPKRKGCVSCGEANEIEQKGGLKISVEGLRDGNMDYESWCGKIEDIHLLREDERVSATDFIEINKPIVVDVREEIEHALGAKIDGSMNIPISKIVRQGRGMIDEVFKVVEDTAGDQPIYFVCQRGNDSQIAARRFTEGRDVKGWVGDLKGGIIELERLHRERYG
jgi:adenylyltransferase/sulfurtransferase